MTVEVGGAGTLGLAVETTLGTFVAPTKWIPIRSESLQLMEDKQYRTNIRGVADRSGQIPGYLHVEGDIVFEVTPDVLLYILYSMRTTPSRTGAGPYTYTFVPAHVAKATTAAGVTNRKTLSMLITRGGNPYGYVGLSCGQLVLTLDNGVWIATASMIGTNESAQSTAASTYSQQTVIGPGGVTLEIPTASARADADTFTFTINDNLQASNRLNGSRFAAYQNWGEREVTLAYEVDFDTRTADDDAFKADTIRTATLKGIANAGVEECTIVLNATAVDTMAVGLSSLGDVNRAAVEMHAFYNTANAYTITLKTAENMT